MPTEKISADRLTRFQTLLLSAIQQLTLENNAPPNFRQVLWRWYALRSPPPGGSSPARYPLARLEALGLVQKSRNSPPKIYNLTEAGRARRALTCRGLLFDLDGVLIDSSANIERHWQNWGAQHGIDVSNVMQIAHGVRTVETMGRIAPHLDAEVEAAKFTAAEVLDTAGVVLIPGAQELLAGLPPGVWAIVTSAGRELAPARLGAVGLPAPAVLVTAEDVKNGKPHPEPYLAGARRLGLQPGDCLVVEDAPAGVQAGRAAGMRVLGVASTHAVSELDGCALVAERLQDFCVVAPLSQEPRLEIWLRNI